jgi:hypothetical protein
MRTKKGKSMSVLIHVRVENEHIFYERAVRVRGRGLVPPSLYPPAAATETALSRSRGGPAARAASSVLTAVLRIRIRIHVFLGLLDPDLDPSNIKQK